MKKLLTHKILPILAVFLLIINIFTINSLAATNITCSNGYSEIVPDLPENPYKDYLIYFFGEDSVYLYQFNFDENNPPRFNVRDGVYKSFFLTNVERNYYLLSGGKWDLRASGITTNGITISTNFKGFYSTCSVYNTVSGEVLNPTFNAPHFLTSKEELESGKFDRLQIDAGDFDFYDDKFILTIYDGVYVSGGIYDYVLSKSFLLDRDSSFLHAADLQIKYYIPQGRLGIDISNGKNYMFELREYGGDIVYSSVTFTIRRSYSRGRDKESRG